MRSRSAHQPLLGLRVDVREVHHVLVQASLLADRLDGRFQRSEARGERHLLLVAELLAGKDQHGVLLERILDLPERGVVQRGAEVDALDAGSEHRVDRRDVQRGHGVLLSPLLLGCRRGYHASGGPPQRSCIANSLTGLRLSFVSCWTGRPSGMTVATATCGGRPSSCLSFVSWATASVVMVPAKPRARAASRMFQANG